MSLQTLCLKIIFSILAIVLLLIPSILGYLLQWHIKEVNDFTVSIYSIYNLIYLTLSINLLVYLHSLIY
jgi:hypothetical protein